MNLQLIEIINNDAVESVDLNAITTQLSEWQQQLGTRAYDLIVNSVIEEINEIILNNTIIWGYK